MIKISLKIEVRMKDGVLVLTDIEGKAVTFSKDQLVQKKVSYDAQYAVLNGVATDLFPQRTGPKKATN
ncbi:unnamed protein product [marine sediment metagenome]|uniref:Uncharacterized protein n=1 Tax=marine sediment metagenome TaxID=412755 RepID=X1IDQ2_9ZZZZ